MANVAAGVATVALTGIAALPYVLRALVRKQLPTATGPHTVGSCVQRDSSGLLVRVFYPIGACEDAPGSPWLPTPTSIYITAIGAFLNLPSAIAGWLLAPGLTAVRGAWVEQAQLGALPAGDDQLPVVCFSHGLGAFQNVYSVLCCELASRGMVVVVPEHADRSACATTYPDDDSPIFCERSSEARMVNPHTGQHDGGFSWRNSQIHTRVEQVFGALGWLLESASATEHVWHGRLDTNTVVMGGHSFGGATTVAACAAAPPNSGGPASIASDLGFKGFCCGVVLDGWLFPVAGDGPQVDTSLIDQSFGHPDFATHKNSAAATPLLFLDAASFLKDQRWWKAKEELVKRGNGSPGHGASALLNLSYSVHHTFSDVLIVGEQAMGLIKKLQRDSRRNIKRGGVADEETDVKPAVLEGDARAPSAADLHKEAVDLMLQFICSHASSAEADITINDGVGSSSEWAHRLGQRNDGAWQILAAGDKLGLQPNYSPTPTAPAATSKI